VTVEQLRRAALTTTVIAATLVALAWSAVAGSTAASAAGRLRSGTVHAQLASHVTKVANGVPTGLQVQGSNVMAAVVAALAFFALAFVVVTLIRRRSTVSRPTIS
jgi:hypothetical protein